MGLDGLHDASGPAGEFRFEAALCRLLQHDPFAPGLSGKPPVDPYLQAVLVAANARRSADTLFTTPLPTTLAPAVSAKLFHERLHYWQLLGCPQIQLRFFSFLDRLYMQAARRGGATHMICSQAQYLPVQPESIDAIERSVARNFSARQVEPAWVKGYEGVNATTGMPFMLVPDGTGASLPAYGALLGFEDGSSSLFAFSGTHLMEAAAHIAEARFSGQPLPRLASAANDEEILYLGAWEFWRRLHGARYSDPVELELAFLAAIDLSFSTDLDADEPGVSMDEWAELTSIPYRFGKVAFRAQGLPKLVLEPGVAPQEAVHAWQQQACSRMGWITPAEAALKFACAITKILLASRARLLAPTRENEQVLRSLWALSGSDYELQELAPAWQLIDESRVHGPQRVGESVLGEMLNACYWRIRRPGDFALPSLTAPQLQQAFPLPIVLMAGRYYHSASPGGGPGDMPLPYRSDIGALARDCIDLQTLGPLARGLANCGFLEDRIECAYVRQGLGCPRRELSTEQATLRERSGLQDWCHATKNHVVLNLAPAEIRDRWHGHWRSQAG